MECPLSGSAARSLRPCPTKITSEAWLMVDEAETQAAVAEYPTICDEFYKHLACVVVTLAAAPTSLLRELLTLRHGRARAPKAVGRGFRRSP